MTIDWNDGQKVFNIWEKWRAVKTTRAAALQSLKYITVNINNLKNDPDFNSCNPPPEVIEFLTNFAAWATDCTNSCPAAPTNS